MFALTGYDNLKELASGLFQVVGMLEMTAHAYLESDLAVV